MKGKVIKIESKDYYLSGENKNIIRSLLPGRFQKENALKKDKLFRPDIVAVGDRVDFDLNKDGTGTIQKIDERRNYISRKAPKIKGAGTRGERLEQIIAANIDNLIIVSSCQQPKFNNRLIDRLLVAAESSRVNPILVINKIDLDSSGMDYWNDLYNGIGYDIFKTSTIKKIGTDELKKRMDGKVNLIWGQSGVGKSSLLNLIYPSLKLKVGEISQSTSKGKHTTVTSILLDVDEDTSVIDTPGIREIDPYGIRKEDLGHYFREFSSDGQCRFNTCTHYHEPGCAVIQAVEDGLIEKERYISYLNLLDTIEDDMNF